MKETENYHFNGNLREKGNNGLETEIRTTGDCDKLLDELELKEERLNDQKAELYILRQKLYDEAPDGDLRCEVVEQKDENIPDWYYSDLAQYDFYLVKGENKKLILSLEAYILEDTKSIESRIEQLNCSYEYKDFTPEEKKVLISAFYKTHELVIKKKAAFDKLRQDVHNQTQEEGNNQIALKDFKMNPDVKEIVNAGYKALAKKYHPDISSDYGQRMQEINEAKDLLDKLLN
ncbi:hypothetical protein [Enterococcus sp.]|uniref:hypothetical protein n=1 Tax=Enterococcus sp. TaxID=35783 RepID=UPI00289F8ACD|nr:hypothetical protein [Enterococcus sp.]